MQGGWVAFKARLWRAAWSKLPTRLQAQIVIVEMAIPELARAGLLETKNRGFLGRAYQIYWWIVFLLLLVAPIRPDQVGFYFPAVIGLTAAWLFALPAYAQGLIDAASTFTDLQPGPTLLADFISGFKARNVQMPEALNNDAEIASASELFSKELPALIPSVLLQIMARLSTHAIGPTIASLVGVLLGPWLASLHVAWLRGWSPVSFLYAVSAPVLPLLVGSMFIPVMGSAYLAYRRSMLPSVKRESADKDGV